MTGKTLAMAVIPLLAIIIGCGSAPPLTPEEQAERQKILAYPLTFTVSKTEIPTVWDRAQVWITKHSSMKLQIVTDAVIQTYTPTDLFQFGYSVTRTPIDSGFSIDVRCGAATGIPGYNVSDIVDLNAHMLARFMKSGT